MTASTPTTPTESITLWTVAWTGGCDDPSFQSSLDEAEAQAQYDAWVETANDREDRITLLRTVITPEGIVTSTKVDEYCPSWQEAPDAN